MTDRVTRIDVLRGDRAHRVSIGAGIASSAGAFESVVPLGARVAFVTDRNVEAAHGARVRAALAPLGASIAVHVLEPGEATKTPETWTKLARAFAADRIDRGALVVALGGGVVSDVAGFTAACWQRGVSWVAVPTTLLAQVDAAIGGKTGIDLPEGKNLLGAFHPPAAVLVDPTLLATLPREEWTNGLGEVLKSALLVGDPLLASLEAAGDRFRDDAALLHDILERCIRYKAAACTEDERDTGVRRLLNLGHTIGHALEGASGYALPHGRAVALGIIAESRLAAALGHCDAALVDRVVRAAERLGLPVSAERVDPARALDFLGLDKKRSARALRFALPVAIGRADVFEVTDVAAIRTAIESLARSP